MRADLEALYVAFILAARNLRDIMPNAEHDLTKDLKVAEDHLLQAAAALFRHIETSNISIFKDQSP